MIVRFAGKKVAPSSRSWPMHRVAASDPASVSRDATQRTQTSLRSIRANARHQRDYAQSATRYGGRCVRRHGGHLRMTEHELRARVIGMSRAARPAATRDTRRGGE